MHNEEKGSQLFSNDKTDMRMKNIDVNSIRELFMASSSDSNSGSSNEFMRGAREGAILTTNEARARFPNRKIGYILHLDGIIGDVRPKWQYRVLRQREVGFYQKCGTIYEGWGKAIPFNLK